MGEEVKRVYEVKLSAKVTSIVDTGYYRVLAADEEEAAELVLDAFREEYDNLEDEWIAREDSPVAVADWIVSGDQDTDGCIQ